MSIDGVESAGGELADWPSVGWSRIATNTIHWTILPSTLAGYETRRRGALFGTMEDELTETPLPVLERSQNSVLCR